MTWPPEDLTWTPPSPWQNTWRCGPGEHQAVMDDLELGPRVAIVWASGQVGCVTPLSSPERLRGMGDGQLAMFGEPR